ncbi:MAG: type III-B CRISPR module RAMP protein Cmr1 [Acidobacteriota bacterium]
MPKPIDIPPCPEIPAQQPSGRTTRKYRISLIMPLFGGGAEAGNPDETLLIRGTAIRGHLRHWWRATIGRRLGDGMWQREEEIFGSTEFPTPLTVHVLDRPHLHLVDPSDGDKFGPTYALFSAIENQRRVAREGISFRLHLGVYSLMRERLDDLRKNRGFHDRATHRSCGRMRRVFQTGQGRTIPPNLLI